VKKYYPRSHYANEVIRKGFLYLVLIGLASIYILPFIWLVSTSLKSSSQIFVIPPQWIPNPIVWQNYRKALTLMPFFTYLKNTCIIAFTTVLGSLLSCSLVAYAFARLRWPGRNIFFILLLSTMMIPFPVTMVPLFILFSKIGWINTFKPLIIPTFCASPFLTFLLRQFFRTIPMQLSDAAKIDGCTELGIYSRIILPLAKPALAVTAIFMFLFVWNDFLGPLIYLTDQDKYTLAIALQLFKGAHDAEWALQMAASTVVILPVIVLFFFTQRYFIEGITLTGMKG